jgi:hypothetical protein
MVLWQCLRNFSLPPLNCSNIEDDVHVEFPSQTAERHQDRTFSEQVCKNIIFIIICTVHVSQIVSVLVLRLWEKSIIQNKMKNLLQELFNNKAEHTVNKHRGSHNNLNLYMHFWMFKIFRSLQTRNNQFNFCSKFICMLRANWWKWQYDKKQGWRSMDCPIKGIVSRNEMYFLYIRW